MTFENCCSGLFNFAPTGCARVFLKIGLDFCNTCNSIYSSNPCPVDYQGTTTCDECCTNGSTLEYESCQSGPPPLPPNPPYSVPIEFGCESGTVDYAMSAFWRNGEARNACLTPGGNAWVLDAMPAVSATASHSARARLDVGSSRKPRPPSRWARTFPST